MTVTRRFYFGTWNEQKEPDRSVGWYYVCILLENMLLARLGRCYQKNQNKIRLHGDVADVDAGCWFVSVSFFGKLVYHVTCCVPSPHHRPETTTAVERLPERRSLQICVR